MSTRTLAAGIIGAQFGIAAAITAGAVTLEPSSAAPAAADASSSYVPPARARWMRVQCQEEDSVNCSWNAAELGNGRGHSFYVVRRPLEDTRGHRTGRVVCVFYVKSVDARRWDVCHTLPAGSDGTFN